MCFRAGSFTAWYLRMTLYGDRLLALIATGSPVFFLQPGSSTAGDKSLKQAEIGVEV